MTCVFVLKEAIRLLCIGIYLTLIKNTFQELCASRISKGQKQYNITPRYEHETAFSL